MSVKQKKKTIQPHSIKQQVFSYHVQVKNLFVAFDENVIEVIFSLSIAQITIKFQ